MSGPVTWYDVQNARGLLYSFIVQCSFKFWSAVHCARYLIPLQTFHHYWYQTSVSSLEIEVTQMGYN
jgi:hypothetical protein